LPEASRALGTTSIFIQFMPAHKTNFQFRTVLSDIEANLIKTGILLPAAIIRDLPKGRVRVEGTMNGAPFALAVLNMKDGSRFFSVSASLRRAARMKVGDRVDVRFKIVDPDKLDVPEELEAVLAQDDQAMKAWEKLTTGFRRSLIHYITSVKNVDSRIKRAIDLMERAKAGLLHGQKKPRASK
jgi:hypothetical protein